MERIVSQIRSLEIVTDVIVNWPELIMAAPSAEEPERFPVQKQGKRYRLQRFDISSPKYDEWVKNRTISWVSEFIDTNNEAVGNIEVIISFDTLLDHVVNASWWKTNKAFLLDGSNNVLITTGGGFDLEDAFPMRSYGSVNELEQNTVEAMEKSSSGTVLGAGSPPNEISGFYRLDEVPWTLVVTAPGNTVLAPIITFRTYYMIALAFCIGIILIFIRTSVNRVTESIKQVSLASNDLARGRFGPPLRVMSRDEIGELTENFNKMTRQLKHRLELKKNIDLAGEVQQSLLPKRGLTAHGIEIYGRTIYCDETGGDYFDILETDHDHDRIGIVVGDVVGHGVGAALLMTTVRALMRSSFKQSNSPAQMMNNVNQLLYKDTRTSGSFVTLFYLEVNRTTKSLQWIRAGHDPAFVVNCQTGQISELKGTGIALGVDPEYDYLSTEIELDSTPHLVLICSDGIFEATGEAGLQFGRERIFQIIPDLIDLPPEKAVTALIEKTQQFVQNGPLDDDLTVAMLKIDQLEPENIN